MIELKDVKVGDVIKDSVGNRKLVVSVTKFNEEVVVGFSSSTVPASGIFPSGSSVVLYTMTWLKNQNYKVVQPLSGPALAAKQLLEKLGFSVVG